MAPVSLGKNGFELPDAPRVCGKTTFLTLDVEPMLAGRAREPSIEMRRGLETHRQYFERGAAGRRHLNLSPLLRPDAVDCPSTIGLRSSSLRWTGVGSVTSFNAPPAMDGTLLVLAPHPDDAEIAAFGLYAGMPSSSWVVCVTAGERGAMNLSNVIASKQDGAEAYWKARLRVWDSLTIPQMGGVPAERCLNLAYPDGELESMSREVDRPHSLAGQSRDTRASLRASNRDRDFQGLSSECTWAGLVSELRLLLEKTKPTIVVCPHPILDDHPDHVYTTVALEQALRASGCVDVAIFLYVVHVRDAPGYPFGCAEAVVSLPPWTDDQWFADSVYSHVVPRELQSQKYFAVEAAHDTRTYERGSPRTFRQLVGALGREVSAFARGVTVNPTSLFLRRAPRPNELYYVVTAASLADLLQRRAASALVDGASAMAPHSGFAWGSDDRAACREP